MRRFHLGVVIPIWSMLWMFGCLASLTTAEAALNVCNRSSNEVWLALVEGKEGQWRSRGWYRLGTGACQSFLSPELKNRYYYGYAFDIAGHVWGGEFDFCVHPETNFDMPGDERCQGHFEGTETRGFFEIDTGDALQFTHELSGLQPHTPLATSGDLWPYDAEKLKRAWARQDYEAVLVRVRPAAVAGRAWALNILGLMYLYGYGVAKDHDLGTAWIRRAAERGWGKAQYNLARLLYESPRGKAQMGQVIYWLRQAAAQGVGAAQQSLTAMQQSPPK